MANETAKIDGNSRASMLGVTDDASAELRRLKVNPSTGRLLVDAAGSGVGDVVGPASSTDNAIARFDGTTGKLLQNSTVTIGDTGGISSTIASGGNTVALTLVQNDTVNNPRTVSLTSTSTGATLFIDPNANASVSTSTGGAVLIENTGNLGSALVIYSNAGASTSGARLLSLRADNVLFDQAVMAISNDGTGAALSINGTGGTGVGVTISTAGTGTNHSLGVNYTGTSATGAAGSFTSTNTAFTTLQISGHEFTHGTIKLSHVGDGISSDANAAGFSMDLQNSDAGTGTTAAQGFFLTSTTGGTTGPLIQFKNNMLALGGADLQVGIMYLSAGGNLGLGTPTAATPTEKLTLGLLGTGKPILMMAETTAPTATAGSGKLWYSSTDSQLHSMDDGGNDWLVQVVPLGADKGVRTAGTNFTTIQGALDDGGETIYVTDQTFTITSQLLLKSSSTKLNLSGGAIIQNNGAVVTTLMAPNTTGLSRIEISGGKFLQTNATAQGIAFDLSDTPNLWMGRTRIEEYGTGIQILDAASASFYSSFRDIQMFNVNNGISLGGTQPNLNLWDNVRIRPKAGGAGTGINLVDTRGNTFLHCDVEPGAGLSAGITGIHLDATTRDNLFLGCWIENNATGVLIDALASNNVFIGGSITSNTTVDITDNGTDTVFWGVNRTGTKLYKVPRITDVLGNEIVIFSATASAVNELTIANAATAGSPTLSATGGDSNIDLLLLGKGTGGVLSNASVVAKTQAASPYTVLTTEVGRVFTNEGATASVTFSLPTAAAGLTYTFIVQDADGIVVDANTGDTIRISSEVSASSGNATSTDIGSMVTLVAINATEWFATATRGTWVVT